MSVTWTTIDSMSEEAKKGTYIYKVCSSDAKVAGASIRFDKRVEVTD